MIGIRGHSLNDEMARMQVGDMEACGRGVVMISSEMPELLGMCDRIYVMNEGRFVAEFPVAEASQERIMRVIVASGSSIHAA